VRGDVSKDANCVRDEEREKEETFMRQTGYLRLTSSRTLAQAG